MALDQPLEASIRRQILDTQMAPTQKSELRAVVHREFVQQLSRRMERRIREAMEEALLFCRTSFDRQYVVGRAEELVVDFEDWDGHPFVDFTE